MAVKTCPNWPIPLSFLYIVELVIAMNIAEILLALTLKDFHTNTQTFKTMITIYIFLDIDSNVKDFSQEKNRD